MKILELTVSSPENFNSKVGLCGVEMPLLQNQKMWFFRLAELALTYEPVPEKTNNLGSDQVQHKLACTVTEDG